MINLIRDKFYRILEKKKITQLQVAQNGNIDHTVLSKSLREKSDPKVSTVYRMARGLDVEPWQLFVDEDSSQVGPLSDEEKALILDFRKIPSDVKKEAVKDTVKAFTD